MATQSPHSMERVDSPDGRAATHSRTASENRTPTEESRSLSDMIKELRDQMTTLLRDEVELAKTEVSEKAARLARNGGYLGAGALVAFAGLILLLMAASAGLYVGLVAAGLAHATAGWLSPLIVGLVVLGIGYGLVQKAVSTFRHEPLVPQRTAESVREDTDWMKRKVK